MTYLRFHLLFNVPALCLLLFLTRNRLRPAHWKCIAALSFAALLATAPWDNWIVHRKVWDFDWTRVTPVAFALGGTTWRLPAEEYAFFLVETLLVSLVTVLFLPVAPRRAKGEGASRPS